MHDLGDYVCMYVCMYLSVHVKLISILNHELMMND